METRSSDDGNRRTNASDTSKSAWEYWWETDDKDRIRRRSRICVAVVVGDLDGAKSLLEPGEELPLATDDR